jgi:hypothetical protein
LTKKTSDLILRRLFREGYKGVTSCAFSIREGALANPVALLPDSLPVPCGQGASSGRYPARRPGLRAGCFDTGKVLPGITQKKVQMEVECRWQMYS